MNKLFKLSAIVLVFIFQMNSENSFAENPKYWCYAIKDTLLDAQHYRFDIFIIRQADPNIDLVLSSYQLSLTIGNHDDIINGGNLSARYIPGTSQLPDILIPNIVEIPLNHNYIKINGPLPESDTGIIIPSDTSLKIGTFEISNNHPFGESPMSLIWRSTGSDSAYIYAIVPPSESGIDITDPDSHKEYLTDPILNAPVEEYDIRVTNNGYCYGDEGVQVYLAGSQSGVLYRLVKDGVAGKYDTLNSVLGNYFPGYQTDGVYYSDSAYRKATYLRNNMLGTKTVVEYPPFAVGPISGDHTICNSTAPPQLTGSIPVGGNTPYSYQWLSSSDSINFSIIDGDTSLNFQPDILTETTYYRLIQKSASDCGSDTSNIVTITVYPPLVVPVIAGIQTICANEQPEPLHIINPPAGVPLEYFYQWFSSEDQSSWDSIPDEINDTLQVPPLSKTTYYRFKISTSPDCGSVYSSAVKITVNPLPEPTSISGDTIVCKNQYHAMYSVDPVPGYLYEWSLDQGLGSFEAGQGTNKTYIHWGETTAASLYLTQTIFLTQCFKISSILIHLIGNSAPDTTTIIRKTGSNMLVCADTTDGIHYQWGYNSMNPDTGIYVEGGTLRYVFLDEIHSSYNYFVDTYYENLGTCTTRSYMYPYALPIGLDEFIKAESNPLIFPNPSNGAINILLPDYYLKSEIQVRLFDLAGRLHFTASVSPSRRISMALPPGLQQGLYIFQLFSATNPVFSTRLSIIK